MHSFLPLSALWSTGAAFILLNTSIAHALAPAVVHTLAGAIAGSSGALAAYPIDYVKSQLQMEGGREKYDDGWGAARDICKASGPFALYRGAGVNIVGIAPEKTIKLAANDMVRSMMIVKFGYLPLAGEILAGGFAGLSQVVVTNPLEVVKVRMQTSTLSIKDVFQQITSFADLYQGAGACIARDVIFSALLFPIYAHLKIELGHDGDSLFWVNMIAGSLAAAPAAFISTPADVIKTRIQQAREEGKESSAPSTENASKKSFFITARDIVRDEGPEILFSGGFERVVRSVPQFGVTLAMFDVVTEYASNHGLMG